MVEVSTLDLGLETAVGSVMVWEHLLAAVRALDSVPGRAQAMVEVSALGLGLEMAEGSVMVWEHLLAAVRALGSVPV